MGLADPGARTERKQRILANLSPALLYARMKEQREDRPDYKYFKIGIVSSMEEGVPTGERVFEAYARAWEEELSSDPAIAARLDALRRWGFEVYFGIYSEPWRDDLQLNIIQNAEADRHLRRAAQD